MNQVEMRVATGFMEIACEQNIELECVIVTVSEDNEILVALEVAPSTDELYQRTVVTLGNDVDVVGWLQTTHAHNAIQEALELFTDDENLVFLNQNVFNRLEQLEYSEDQYMELENRGLIYAGEVTTDTVEALKFWNLFMRNEQPTEAQAQRWKAEQDDIARRKQIATDCRARAVAIHGREIRGNSAFSIISYSAECDETFIRYMSEQGLDEHGEWINAE